MAIKDKVFTSGEAARICGVSADTVSRWFDSGLLKGYRLGRGGDRRIPYEDLRRFMLERNIPLDRLDDRNQRVVVVDDDPYYLELIATALSKKCGFTVYTASTGFDAGTLVAEHNPGLVILDIQLSDMDGRIVCQRIKQREDTRDTYIIGISGFIDFEQEGKTLRELGFDDFLKKPFQIDDLCNAAVRLLGR